MSRKKQETGMQLSFMPQSDGTNEVTPAHIAIYSEISNPNGSNVIIDAVAGAGKTKTIVRSLDVIPKSKRVLFLALLKRNVEDLENKVPKHVSVQTLNSLGHGAWMGWLRKHDFDPDKCVVDKNKIGKIASLVCGDNSSWGTVASLVSKAKSAGMEPITDDEIYPVCEDTYENWLWLIDHYDLEHPIKYTRVEQFDKEDESIVVSPTCSSDTKNILERWKEQAPKRKERREGRKKRYNIKVSQMPTGEWIGLAREVLRQSFAEKMVIDFDDQKYMTVLLGASVHKYDYVFLDEAQDASELDHELVAHAVRDGGRIIAVGDKCQSVYGFRGASSDSMEKLKNKFNMKLLYLHVSYRCPKLIVEQAQKYVSHIEAHPNAPIGEVFGENPTLRPNIIDSMVDFGDMVICRFVAPLVQARLEFLKRGIPATVLGQEIGDMLINLIAILEPNNLIDLGNKLNMWEKKETDRAISEGSLRKEDTIKDKADSLRVFMESSHDLEDLGTLIINTFGANQDNRITLSTIHKAKGLEWDRVFIINIGATGRITKAWMKEQENNLKYVAVTRAKKELHFVSVSRKKSIYGERSAFQDPLTMLVDDNMALIERE